MMRRTILVAVTLLAIGALILGIVYLQGLQSRTLRVTTTTSLYATGLLDVLAEEFERKNPGVSVEFVAVGSGEALRRAAMGDAELVLAHAPSLEKKYLGEGVLKPGRIFAYNYFLIVGPSDDPAGIKGLSPIEAFERIYRAGEEGKAVFVSRGDNSGTHVRELAIWRLAGLDPRGRPWYIEAGAGMDQTLMIANEKKAYTVSDIGTYLKFSSKLGDLKPLVTEGDILINIYSAYPVNPAKVRGVNEELAEKFIDFLTSSSGQDLIRRFSNGKLFKPVEDAEIEKLQNAWSELAELRE